MPPFDANDPLDWIGLFVVWLLAATAAGVALGYLLLSVSH